MELIDLANIEFIRLTELHRVDSYIVNEAHAVRGKHLLERKNNATNNAHKNTPYEEVGKTSTSSMSVSITQHRKFGQVLASFSLVKTVERNCSRRVQLSSSLSLCFLSFYIYIYIYMYVYRILSR